MYSRLAQTGGKQMTVKQYSELQRLLGVLDGLSWSMPDNITDVYESTIDSIGKIIDEIQFGDNSQK